jgi:glycerol-3-phosphate acyltransferase PlsY
MSDKDLMTLLMAVGAFVIFGLPIIYLIRHRMKIKRVWKELAKKYNLTYHEGR